MSKRKKASPGAQTPTEELVDVLVANRGQADAGALAETPAPAEAIAPTTVGAPSSNLEQQPCQTVILQLSDGRQGIFIGDPFVFPFELAAGAYVVNVMFSEPTMLPPGAKMIELKAKET
jgi:hypothetical protein